MINPFPFSFVVLFSFLLLGLNTVKDINYKKVIFDNKRNSKINNYKDLRILRTIIIKFWGVLVI